MDDNAWDAAVQAVAPQCMQNMDEESFIQVTLNLVGLDTEQLGPPPDGSVQGVKLRRATIAQMEAAKMQAQSQGSACCLVS